MRQDSRNSHRGWSIFCVSASLNIESKLDLKTGQGLTKRVMTKSSFVVFSASFLALGLTCFAGRCGAQSVNSADWASVQRIVGPIHGVSTAPPDNLVTPKFTAGALMGNGDLGVVAGDSDASQQTFRFGKSDFWGTHWNDGHKAPEVSILSFGSLTISSPAAAVQANFPEAGGDSTYHMDQDILHGEVTTTVRMDGRAVHMRSWVADGENVFVTEIWAEGTGGDPMGRSMPVAVHLAMPAPDAAPHMTVPAAAGSENGVLWVNRENNLEGANDYKARGAIAVHLLGASMTNIAQAGTAVTGNFTLTDNEPVDIVAVFQSDARIGLSGPSTVELANEAVAHARRIATADVRTLEAEHLKWWKDFWLRSFVDLHDPVLEDYYYGSLYLLGMSSRPGKPAPSLWGNFITTDNAGWGGRYFMNYNEEAPYYGVFSSNHADLAEPYNRMVLAQVPWQKNRTAEAGYQGVAYQRTFSPFTVIAKPPEPVTVALVKDVQRLPADQKSNAMFSFLPVFDYYDYTQDKAFLRDKLYPAMRELEAFWRDYAVRDENGHWSFEHTSAHEGGDDVNPNLDIGFAHRVESELIADSEALNVDAAMRPVWKKFSDELSPYPQGETNGKAVYYEAERLRPGARNPRLFVPGDQPINLEGLVFPGENLAIGGDATELEIARNSMEEMNSWGVTPGGNSHNGFCKEFPIAARIGWPADDLLAKFKAAILFQWRASNLTVFQSGGGIETAGSIEAIDSMLLQHEGGVLRVFPDWPADKDAAFTRLLAKGAFLVSSEQRNGAVPFIDITSEVGGALTIASPWGEQAVRLAGRSEELRPKSGLIVLETARGAHYELTPAGSKP
jgi:hypothetical protein